MTRQEAEFLFGWLKNSYPRNDFMEYVQFCPNCRARMEAEE